MHRTCRQAGDIGIDGHTRVRGSLNGYLARYRNFSISLLLVNEDTMRLGVDGHVCELQLGVAAIEQHRNGLGHTNYTKWRDARAE